VAATSPSPTTTTLDNRGDEGDGARPGDVPTGSNIPVGPVQDGHTEISHTVDRAEEAVKGMDTMTAWEGAIGVVKQVLDYTKQMYVSSILHIRCFDEFGFLRHRLTGCGFRTRCFAPLSVRRPAVLWSNVCVRRLLMSLAVAVLRFVLFFFLATEQLPGLRICTRYKFSQAPPVHLSLAVLRKPIYVQCVVSVALLLSLHVSHGFPVSY
jgi:hypothetical protein